METTSAKPQKHPISNPIAEGIAICDTKWVQPYSLQSILKNIITAPE